MEDVGGEGGKRRKNGGVGEGTNHVTSYLSIFAAYFTKPKWLFVAIESIHTTLGAHCL